MKLYADNQLTFYRTQALAKASGKPFQLVEVPTDHNGLCEFLNSIQPPLEMLRTPEEILNISQKPVKNTEIIEQDHSYKNGDPIGIYLGSRNPDAIFICTACGENNKPKRSYPHRPIISQNNGLQRENQMDNQYEQYGSEQELQRAITEEDS